MANGFIAEALKSILGQTYPNLEVIVVDDGSIDGTGSVVRGFGDRIRYYRQPNAGAPAARDEGIRLSTGDLIAFLDADDLWHPEKLDRQWAWFEARPELDLCCTHVQHFWIPELSEEAKQFQNHRLSQILPSYQTQALLARKTLFQRIGTFDSGLKLADAMDWFLRAIHENCVMELLPEALWYRRIHRANGSLESDTHKMTRQMQEALLKVTRDSLLRRRGEGGNALRTYKFPSSNWEN